MWLAIFALFSLQILLPSCLADKALLSRPSEHAFTAAAVAGAFTVDCSETTEERRNSAEPLSLLQVTRAAHRHSFAGGKEFEQDIRNIEAAGPANESLVAKVSANNKGSPGVALQDSVANLQTGVQQATLSSSDTVAAGVSADTDGINSTSATAVLFLVFMLVVFCALYVVTTQIRFEPPTVGTSAGDTGKFAVPSGPEVKPQSVQQFPSTSSRLKFEAGTPGGFSTSPYRDASFDLTGGIPETEPELPTIYPSLVMPVARTRLAIPIEPLADASFEVDVLGVSGVPLLCAALAARSDGMPEIQISLNSAGMLLAVVTPSLQLFNAHGNLFGTLSRSGDAGEQYTLHDLRGRLLLSLLPGSEAGEVKMVSHVGARQVERASMIRRAPGGRLPAEHYEIVVSPGVDAVLVLACFLSLVVFALPGNGP